MASQEIGRPPNPELTPTRDGIHISLTMPDQTYVATIGHETWQDITIKDRLLMVVGSSEDGIDVRPGLIDELSHSIHLSVETDEDKIKARNAEISDEMRKWRERGHIGKDTEEDSVLAKRIYLTERGQEHVQQLLEELS